MMSNQIWSVLDVINTGKHTVKLSFYIVLIVGYCVSKSIAITLKKMV